MKFEYMECNLKGKLKYLKNLIIALIKDWWDTMGNIFEGIGDDEDVY